MNSKITIEDTSNDLPPNYFDIPKYSWETESHCDESTEIIPTYSWEYDTSSPIHKDDSTSTGVPDSQCSQNISLIPNTSQVSDFCPGKRVHQKPTYLREDGPISIGNGLLEENKGEFCIPIGKLNNHSGNEDMNVVFHTDHDNDVPDHSNQGFGSTSTEYNSRPYEDEFAQCPEEANLNIDVDAIQRELCDGFLDSPPKAKKGKKYTKWF